MSLTVPGHSVDRLYSIRDPATGTDLFVFDSAMPTLDLPVARPSLSYQVPGVDAPIDPNGIAGNALAKRAVTYHWTQRLNGGPSAGQTYSAVLRALMQACGDGRRIQLVRRDDTGLEWIGLGKLTDFPLKIDLQSAIAAEFAMTWELNPPVFRQLYPPTWFFFDTGRFFDDTANPWYFDTTTLPNVPLVAASNSGTVTNVGDAEDKYPTVTLTGPFPGLIGVALYAPNGTLRYYFTWSANLGRYDTLVISAALGTVRLNGVPAFGDGRFVNQLGGNLFGVPAGACTVVVNTTGAGPYGQLRDVIMTGVGSGYLTAPAVSFTSVDGNGSGATGHAVLNGGAVAQVVIDTQGSGYTQPPTVGVGAPPAGGVQATAISTLATCTVDFRATRM